MRAHVFSFLVGFGVAITMVAFTVRAAPQDATVYRVVGSNKDSTMEREINQLAEHGCKVIAATGAGYTEALAILECPAGAPSLHR